MLSPSATTRDPSRKTVTIIEAINRAASQLSAAGIADARFDAEVLLRHTLEKDRAWLLAHLQESLDTSHTFEFEQIVARRAKREPLQHIIGKQEFWGLSFRVTPDVLIPRPETEFVIETALRQVPKKNEPLVIVDLCTGSGCIAVSLATELPAARIFAIDKSGKALAVARENARAHRAADRIQFLEGDLFRPLEKLDLHGQVDIIVSNPPYVPSGDYEGLQTEVRDHEPVIALVAGSSGTEVHERIIEQAPRFLKKGGGLVMEMGIGQATELVSMLEKTSAFTKIDVSKDLAGIERVIAARKK